MGLSLVNWVLSAIILAAVKKCYISSKSNTLNGRVLGVTQPAQNAPRRTGVNLGWVIAAHILILPQGGNVFKVRI